MTYVDMGPDPLSPNPTNPSARLWSLPRNTTRAIYLAEKMGLEAYGVCAVEHQYTAQDMREIREIAARCKDFFMIVVGEERTEAIFKRVFLLIFLS